MCVCVCQLEQVSRLNYLDHVVELLGQLPTADLEKLLRVKPSGAEDTSQVCMALRACSRAILGVHKRIRVG